MERKTLGDLVSSIFSGRLSAHQLPGMLKTYDVAIVVVEGIWRPTEEGAIEVWWSPRGENWGKWVAFKSQATYRAVVRYLMTLRFKARIHVERTTCVVETARWAYDLYRWWNEKAWEDHHAHLQADRTFDPRPDRLLWREPDFVQQVAMAFPGIGETRSFAAAESFESVWEMVAASAKEWSKVDGVGPLTAGRLWAKLREKRVPRKIVVRAGVGDRDAARQRYRKNGPERRRG